MDKVFPFKVKKSGKGKFSASFNINLDGEPIRKYVVTIGKPNKSSVSSDFGKVSSNFQTIMFNEATSGYGQANLDGGMGIYVLNTVARIVLEYTKKANPQGFTFTAAESSVNSNSDGNQVGHSNSRRKAYRALALMVGTGAGFVNITKNSAMTTGSFYLMKNDLFQKWQDAVNSNSIV
jgi:hypothetical protein